MPRRKTWPKALTVGPCGYLAHVWGHIEDGEWWCAECCDFFPLGPDANWEEVKSA